MVSIKKKNMNGNTYYYLEHSYRKNGKVNKKEKYLGPTLPKNIDQVKQDFLREFYQETWFNRFDTIKEQFIIEKRKIPSSLEKKEAEHFAITFTYNTNRIEGSTITLRETADLLERGISPSQRPLEDIKETEAHKEVFTDMLNYKKEITLPTVLYWHKQLFQYTKPDDAGKIRQHPVGISGSKFFPPYPIELDLLLRDFFDWYQQNKKTIHPVHLAGLAHLKFVTIHPFGDGNGRLSRLLMNYVLHKNGYPMLIIPYSQRKSYYTALQRSQLKKDENVFILWFFKRYLKEYKHHLI
ncbi:MAG: Fic family protein [Euryarchaeota archaeon]|nr:Fic family protein [Euryarchaeota archaeon]